MKPKDIILGAFYFHLKTHHCYIGTTNKRLVALCSGKYMLPPDNVKIKHNHWDYFRPALPDEIINNLNKNKHFHRHSIYETIK